MENNTVKEPVKMTAVLGEEMMVAEGNALVAAVLKRGDEQIDVQVICLGHSNYRQMLSGAEAIVEDLINTMVREMLQDDAPEELVKVFKANILKTFVDNVSKELFR